MPIEKLKVELSTKKKLVLVAILGLTIRLVLAPFTGHPFDIYVWYQASESILKGNLIPSGGFTLMPAWYYTIVPITYAYQWLSLILSAHPTPFNSFPPLLQSAAGWTVPAGSPVYIVTDWLYNLLIKIPSIIADLVVGLVIYRILLPRYGNRAAILSFSLWFLNPMLIWISSVWGMYDSLPALFSLLAIYFLVEDRFILTSIMITISIAFKLYALFLIPILLIYAYRSRRSIKALVLPTTLSAVLGLAFFFPLITSGFQNYYISVGSGADSSLQAFGLTYWSIEPFIQITTSVVHSINVLVFFTLLFLFASISLVAMRRRDEDALFILTLALSSVLFFSYPTVNEQWFVWLLPTLVILSAKKKISRGVVIALSIIALLYSLVNSQIVAFFLPSYVFGTTAVLEHWAQEIAAFSFIRLPSMALLGVVFSAALGAVLVVLMRALGQTTHSIDEL